MMRLISKARAPAPRPDVSWIAFRGTLEDALDKRYGHLSSWTSRRTSHLTSLSWSLRAHSILTASDLASWRKDDLEAILLSDACVSMGDMVAVMELHSDLTASEEARGLPGDSAGSEPSRRGLPGVGAEPSRRDLPGVGAGSLTLVQQLLQTTPSVGSALAASTVRTQAERAADSPRLRSPRPWLNYN